jgi:putative SOS response-associated peptidase YedK
VTDEPPPEVRAPGHDRMIVNLLSGSVESWLTPQGSTPQELQALLDERESPYYEHQVEAA